MSNQKRKEVILALLEANGKVIVHELAKDMDVSEKTIRRDLDKMEKEGLLVRSHGGAVPPDVGSFSHGQREVELPREPAGELPEEPTRELSEERREELPEEPAEKLLEERVEKLPEERTENVPETRKEERLERLQEERIVEPTEELTGEWANVEASKPDWFVKAVENTWADRFTSSSSFVERQKSVKSVGQREFPSITQVIQSTMERVENSKSSSAIQPISSLRDINLLELEQSIPPETLAELMKIAEESTEEKVDEAEGFAEEEIQEEASEDEGIAEVVPDMDEAFADEVPEEDEFADGAGADEWPEDEELSDEVFDVDYEYERGEAPDIQRLHIIPKEAPWQDPIIDYKKAYKRRVADFYEDQEQVERPRRTTRQEKESKQSKSAKRDRRAAPSERSRATVSRESVRNPGVERNKPSSIRRILDWIHIIVALIIFVGGLILAVYIIQSNRTQQRLLDEISGQYESVIYEELGLLLPEDGDLYMTDVNNEVLLLTVLPPA